MNPLLQSALGAILRWALALGAGWLVEHGIWSQSEASTYVTAAVLALLSLGWGLWQKYHERIKFLTALESPSGTSEATIVAKIKTGGGAPLALLLLGILVGSLSACASAGPRHVATVTVVSAHATLALVQDTEMTLACGKPGAPAPPACIPADVHRQISAHLATAFEADGHAAQILRDWPGVGAPPTQVASLLSAITTAVAFVLDHLPAGATKARLLAQIGGPR